MIKRIIIFLVLFLCLGNIVFAIDLSEFSSEIKKYSNEYFPELKDENLVENVTNIEDTFSVSNLLHKLLHSVTGELKNNISLIFKIIGIAILCAVLKSIQSNFGETGISEIAFYVCYLLVVILIVTSFTNIVELCRSTVNHLSQFMEFLIPIVISFLAVTGKITTVAMLQPVLLAMISIITVMLTNFIIPVFFISTVINIISNISEHINVKRISELLKKSALWCVEISLVIFASVLSLEGSLAANVDGVTAKTAKSVVSNAIPVVGKLLGDTVDSVMGGLSITKNAVGTIGVMVIIAMTIVPLVRTLILMFTFNLAAAIIEPIADGRIVKCMSAIGDSVKILFAILATTTFLFVIAITLMIRMTNFSV
ncbi:MAG: stage III sporulation protein AE [Clostridia bacterium]|nr:stage III sporulation protein AE [Clostridia bacterium]